MAVLIAEYLLALVQKGCHVLRTGGVQCSAGPVHQQPHRCGLGGSSYILAYKFDTDEKGHPSIKIALKWNAQNKCNAIKGLKRVSRPGLRKYASVAEMPRVLNGLGIAILSTSKGIMTDAKARKENVGGEVLCYVF